jgi:hypothetical protein
MAKRKASSHAGWFDNCGGWRPRHDLDELRRGIERAGSMSRTSTA